MLRHRGSADLTEDEWSQDDSVSSLMDRAIHSVPSSTVFDDPHIPPASNRWSSTEHAEETWAQFLQSLRAQGLTFEDVREADAMSRDYLIQHMGLNAHEESVLRSRWMREARHTSGGCDVNQTIGGAPNANSQRASLHHARQSGQHTAVASRALESTVYPGRRPQSVAEGLGSYTGREDDGNNRTEMSSTGYFGASQTPLGHRRPTMCDNPGEGIRALNPTYTPLVQQIHFELVEGNTTAAVARACELASHCPQELIHLLQGYLPNLTEEEVAHLIGVDLEVVAPMQMPRAHPMIISTEVPTYGSEGYMGMDALRGNNPANATDEDKRQHFSTVTSMGAVQIALVNNVPMPVGTVLTRDRLFSVYGMHVVARTRSGALILPYTLRAGDVVFIER